MYDKEKIARMIGDIEKYFTELERFNLNEKTIQDTTIVYASSMALFGIINRTIDLAEEIIIKNEWGMPRSYEEYYEVLADNGVIGKDLAKKIKQLAKDRNLFAHAYQDVKRKEVLEIKKRISEVKEFVDKVKKIVSKDTEK